MNDPKAPAAVGQQRVIRVFVSSTFRDLRAEREELVKRIFPQLRKLCEGRGVTWGEVDLRWGITDEQKAEGKVLPICLVEINRSRPYFIGLLGERYGWVPREIDSTLIEREPWLAQHYHRSITELEILHGVLNNPAMAEHAFFYFRSPAFIETLPANQQEDLREEPIAEEIQRYGREEAERRAEERRHKLAALKQRIRTSDLPVRENYRDPAELGRLVLEDLTAVIDRLYPEGSQLDPLDREANDHEVFAANRRRVYIGRKEYLERLDMHAAGDGPPLVVFGDSGLGKSALLANWALQHRAEQPRELVLIHFVGSSRHSADWRAMVRRIMGELRRRFSIEQEVPDRPDELRRTFGVWLRAAADRGRLVLIIDGLNQLEDRDGALELAWLPQEIPSNVRLILSTTPGRPLDALSTRRWPTIEIEPLDSGQRRQLIAEFLGRYGKALPEQSLEQIASAGQTGSPLYLSALLDELRLYGEHTTLNERIDYYLSAATPTDLYDRILERYEQDYGSDFSGSLGYALSNLWAARYGLSEAELFELLGARGDPFPAARWAPFHLAAESLLIERSGLIGFSHQYIRDAVQRRYLAGERERLQCHQFLGYYFMGESLAAGQFGPRMVEECPWQLRQAQDWKLLASLLSTPQFVAHGWLADHYQVAGYWSDVEAHSSFRVLEAFSDVLRAPSEYGPWLYPIARLLEDMGHLKEALALRNHLLAKDPCQLLGPEAAAEVGAAQAQALNLSTSAILAMKLGNLDEASRLFKEEEELLRHSGDEAGVASCLGNQAYLLRTQGNLEEAVRLFSEVEALLRKLNDRRGIAALLDNLASIALQRGSFDQALALYREAEGIWRELNDVKEVASSLGGQASALEMKGEFGEAFRLSQEEEGIARRLGDKSGVVRGLSNKASAMIGMGQAYDALLVLKEMEQLCREMNTPEPLAVCLANQARALLAQNRVAGAVRVAEEAYQIASANGLGRVAAQVAQNLARLRSAINQGK